MKPGGYRKSFDENRVRQGDSYLVKAEQDAVFAPTSGDKPKIRENCGQCVWIEGCVSGTCTRRDKTAAVETHPATDVVIGTIVEKANASLVAKLARPAPKVLEGSTPMIHARRRVVQAVLALAHFEVKNTSDKLHDRKADLELALIEYEEAILRRAK